MAQPLPKAVLFFSNQLSARQDTVVLQRMLCDCTTSSVRELRPQWRVTATGAIPKGTSSRTSQADILVDTGDDDVGADPACADDAERVARRIRRKLKDMFPGVEYRTKRHVKKFTFPFPGGSDLRADIYFHQGHQLKVVVEGQELTCEGDSRACEAVRLLREMQERNEALPKFTDVVLEALVLHSVHRASKSKDTTHPWLLVFHKLHTHMEERTLTKLAAELSMFLPPSLPVSVDPSQLLPWAEGAVVIQRALRQKTFDKQKHVVYLLSGNTQYLAEKSGRQPEPQDMEHESRSAPTSASSLRNPAPGRRGSANAMPPVTAPGSMRSPRGPYMPSANAISAPMPFLLQVMSTSVSQSQTVFSDASASFQVDLEDPEQQGSNHTLPIRAQSSHLASQASTVPGADTPAQRLPVMRMRSGQSDSSAGMPSTAAGPSASAAQNKRRAGGDARKPAAPHGLFARCFGLAA